MFGKPFEMPSNLDLEQAIEKNMSHINPVEIKKYTGSDGNKRLFPFWTPVKDAEGVTFTDYKKYLSNRDKALDIKKKSDDDKTGVVQVKDPEKTYEDGSLLDKIQKLVEKHNKTSLNDQSLIVDPKSENMKSTATKKLETKLDQVSEVKVEKSADSKTGVGAVKPKAAMNKQTEVDVTAGSKKASGDMVGVVKAKSEFKTSVTNKNGNTTIKSNELKKPAEPKASKDSINLIVKPNVTTEKPKSDDGFKNADKTGAVKSPKNEIKPQPSGINFDKFKTDHITKPVKK